MYNGDILNPVNEKLPYLFLNLDKVDQNKDVKWLKILPWNILNVIKWHLVRFHTNLETYA